MEISHRAKNFYDLFTHSQILYQKAFSKVEPRNKDSWIWKSLLFGRVVCLKRIDVQVWGGNLSFIVDNSFKIVNKESRKDLPRIKQFICPFTHTWNTKKMDSRNDFKHHLEGPYENFLFL